MIVDDEWPAAEAADEVRVSWPTAKRWSDCYWGQPEATGQRVVECGEDLPAQPPHQAATRAAAPVVRKVAHLRWKKRLGPVQIGGRLGMLASTVHAVLVRRRVNRLVPGLRAEHRALPTQKHA